MDTIRIVKIDSLSTASQLSAALALMQYIQPQIIRSIELLQWQYLESPGGPGRIFTLWESETLAAVYCAVAQRVQVGPIIFPGRMVQDVMTHPNYRGRGFLHRLATVCLEDMRNDGAIGYTFPNELSEGSFRRTGWAELNPIPLRSKDLRSTDLQSSHLSLAYELNEPFTTLATRIWQSSNIQVGVVHDQEFLNWRYKKPSQQYRSFLLKNSSGILVLKCYDNGHKRTVHICELFVDEQCYDLILDAILFAEAFAKFNQADTLTAWLGPRHPYAPYFLCANFNLIESVKRYMFVACPQTVFAACANSSLWHISQGDSDVY